MGQIILILVKHAGIVLSEDTYTVRQTEVMFCLPIISRCLDSQANLADFGDNQWVTCFQETAEVLLGRKAEELGQLRETVRL